ncbi:MAG: hypothetical protein M3Q19_15515 [Pseudomonadota bacterium]|nr:hypothetical protein [Pseudomonadota bacterium]
MIASKIATPAAGLIAAMIQAPATSQPIENDAPRQVQCSVEAPAQFGPRTPLRPVVQSCAAATQTAGRCGRYELYWPHWLAQRALPPVRQWVNARC